MPHIIIYDKDGNRHEATVDPGIDLIDAAEEAGVSLAHACGRGGWCSTCAVTVRKGVIGEDLTEMGPEEIQAMEEADLDPKTQVLSCSSQIFGDVEVAEAGAILD